MDTFPSSPSSQLPVSDDAASSPLTEDTSFSGQQQSPQQLRPPRTGRRIFLISLLLAIIIALGIGLWLFVRTLDVQKAYDWLYRDDQDVFEEPSDSPSPVVEVLDVMLTPGNSVTDIEVDLQRSDLSPLDTELRDLELEASAAADEE